MAARGLRRKRNTLTDLKIAVVGSSGVGKSALTVRYLTRRFIGEYDCRTENRYKHETLIDGDPALFEIIDTCVKPSDEMFTPNELIQMVDGLLLVFSITDRNSFNYIRRAKIELQADIPLYLVGNKGDMLHLRKVGRSEAEELAKDLKCKFSEISAADQIEQVQNAFEELCREVIASKRKSKPSLLGRVLRSGRVYSRGKSDSNLPKD